MGSICQKSQRATEPSHREGTPDVKILLLGTGESGKSTFTKQICLSHGEGYSPQDLQNFKFSIFGNLLFNMRALIEAAREFEYPIGDADATNRMMGRTPDYFSGTSLSKALVQDIKTLWKDDAIQKAYSRQSEFQIFDSAAYYFSQIDRIEQEDYQPNREDILRTRTKTLGITKISFKHNDLNFQVNDVGGQKSERKKWRECIQDTSVIIFCVALSEYDLKLSEDDVTPRMTDSLEQFETICNNDVLPADTIILYLNKKDLFQEKIKTISLTTQFPDYDQSLPHDYEHAFNYIKDQFVERSKGKKKILVYETCATDPDDFQNVFEKTKEDIAQIYKKTK